MVTAHQPGNLPMGANVMRDPYPGWRPPKPTEKSGNGQVTAL